jgi:hypothetical protein
VASFEAVLDHMKATRQLQFAANMKVDLHMPIENNHTDHNMST